MYRLSEVLVRAGLLAFWDFRAEGVENVPAEGPVILACTHQSHLDPVMARAPLSRPVGYVARSTLFRNRLFAGLIRKLGAISFDRESSSLAELKGVIDCLTGGAALVFFPEGTRSLDGSLGRLRPGIALLAKRSGAPVVPIAVEGTFQCWPRNRKLFRPGRVRVVYGESVCYGGGYRRKEVLSDLSNRLAGLKERAASMA